MCLDQNVEPVIFDSGDSLTLLMESADGCLMDRGIYGLIIVCSDQQTVDIIVEKCNKEKIPVSVLGISPSDTEALKAISVTNDPARGDEKLTAVLLNRSGSMINGTQPLFIPSGSDRDNIYINFLNLEKASWNLLPVILENDNPDKIKTALKENRAVNMIILSGDKSLKNVKRYLTAMGRWLPSRDMLHICIGSLDASEQTIEYMEKGYIDYIGTRDIIGEAEGLVNPLLTAIDERNDFPSFLIHVPGIVLTAKDIDDPLKKAWIADYTAPVTETEEITEPVTAGNDNENGRKEVKKREKKIKEEKEEVPDIEVIDDDNERGPKNPKEKKEKPPKDKNKEKVPKEE